MESASNEEGKKEEMNAAKSETSSPIVADVTEARSANGDDSPESSGPVAASASTSRPETNPPRRVPIRQSTRSTKAPMTYSPESIRKMAAKSPSRAATASSNTSSSGSSNTSNSDRPIPHKAARKAAQFALIEAAKKSFGGTNSSGGKRGVDGSIAGEPDDGDWSTQSFPNYALLVHTMLEETHSRDPDVMRWSEDGLSFTVNAEHPRLIAVLQKYFDQSKYVSFHRQLNTYGWSKSKGWLFHPIFRRDMNHADFDLIRRKDKPSEYLTPEQQIRMVAARARERAAPQKGQAKYATEKKKASEERQKKRPAKAGAPIAAKAGTKRPSASTATSKGLAAPASKKRRSDEGRASSVGATGRLTTATAKKKPSKPPTEKEQAANALSEYKELQNCYTNWTLWSLPPQLKQKLQQQNKARHELENEEQRKKDRDGFSDDEGSEASVNLDPLLCKEDFPFDGEEEDDDQVQTEFVDRIVQDARRRKLLEEGLDRMCQSTSARGKTLPASKFNKPNTKWRSVSVGARIGVYWRDDDQHYSASVIKHQEGSSYFHLLYDDDGALEWLDLSREEFIFLDNVVSSDEASIVGQSNAGTTGPLITTDQTPRKDNRSSSLETPGDTQSSITVPENHAHLAPLLRYSWRDLELGRTAGTPAYNDFIQSRDASAAPVTPLQVLQDVQSFRLRGFAAPPARNEDQMETINANHVATTRLSYLMRVLKDDISKDTERLDHEGTVHAVRRVTDHWKPSTLVENLRRLETQTVVLGEREAQVLDRCKRAGVL